MTDVVFPVVDAYLGLGSRYSYLASTQLDRIAADVGVTFNWLPVASPELFSPGRNPFEGPPISGQYDPAYRAADSAAWAEFYGVPFREPTGRLTFDPHLLVTAALAAGHELRVAMMIRLFAAVFVDQRSKIEAVDCIDCAEEIGLNRHAFRRALADPVVEVERLAILERAKTRGVFGVPFFITGNKSFFGNDRLVLLTHHLRKVNAPALQGPKDDPIWAWPTIERR